ncbi:primosome assembly protein PriA, partial [Streptomyces toxytricini]
MSSENESRQRPGDGSPGGPPEQLALIREMVAEAKAKAPKAKPRTWRGAALAKDLPVARVLVNKGVLHLDQLWDYAVPEELSEAARPGVRVRVRFGAGSHHVHGGRREGGRLIDGF